MQELNLDTSQKLNITCKTGDTFMWQARFYNAFLLFEEDNPKNLAGAIIRMQVRQMDVLKLSFALGDGITLFATNGITNGVQLSKSATQMQAIKRGKYEWDLEIEENGIVTTLIYGDFMVNADVTRS